MKTLISFLALISVLTISYMSQAQEALPYRDIDLSLDLPTGEHAMGSDGVVYIIYTEEQNKQLKKIYDNYRSLSSYNLQLWELNVDLSNDVNKELTLNQKLNERLAEANKTNYELKLNLEQTQEKRFVKAMGLSLLVGLGMGLLGVGIGSAL